MRRLLFFCFGVVLFGCPLKPSEPGAKTQPASEPQSGPVMEPKAPLLAPLGAGLGSEVRALLRYVPAKTELLFIGDIERLVKGPLWKASEGFLKKLYDRPEIVDFEKEVGFHPISDVRGAVLAVGDTSKAKVPSLLIVRAHFDEKRLTEYFKKNKAAEEKLFVFPRGSALAIAAPEVLLLGDTDLVREALSSPKESLSPFLRGLLNEIDPGRPFSFALELTSAGKAVLILPPEFDGATGGAGWLDLSAGLEAKAFLRFQNKEQMQAVLDDINRNWPIEKQALQTRKQGVYVEKLSFSGEEKDLKISWELAAGDTLRFFVEVIGFNLEGLLKSSRVELPQSTSAPASTSSPTTSPTTTPTSTQALKPTP